MRDVLRIIAAALLLATLAGAQAPNAPPASTTPPAPVQPAGTRRPAQAKTQDEMNAYNEVRRMTPGPQAEAAAKQFEQKFPQSELRALIYENLMDSYRANNNADKVIEMGRKALSLDPDNPLVLVMLGNVLAENARETDPDVNAEYAEAMKYAKHGLETMNTGLVVQPGTSADQVALMKQLLTAMAYSAIGWVELKQRNDAAAEKDLQQAARLNVVQPDPMVYLRLAIALDHQNKYAEALAAANKVIELSPNGSVADLARQEKDRLEKLTAKPAAPAAPPTPPTATPTPATPEPPSTPPKR